MDPRTQSDHMEDVRPNDAGSVLDDEPDVDLELNDDESGGESDAPTEG